MTKAALLRPVLCLLVLSTTALAAPLDDTLKRFVDAVPKRAAEFAAAKPAALAAGVQEIENAASEVARQTSAPRADLVAASVSRLLAAKLQIDALLEQTLGLRTEFTSVEPVETQRLALRNYLRVNSQLIDLSGRLRYLQFDSFNQAAGQFAARPADRQKFLETLIKARSSIGAEVMAELLFDPPADSDGRRPSEAERVQVLKLIEVSNQHELLPQLARFVNTRTASAALLIQAGETIRSVGLPQDPRPGQDPTLPAAPITARQLHAALASVNVGNNSNLKQRRDELLTWLDGRMKQGITDDRYRLGAAEVMPGDWLLMRNPSPYNLFTDLSPGLFTHVGIVTLEQGSDGLRRMVVVDMPEPGNRMPATNVDTFVKRTRHYVLLRHEDPTVAHKIAEVARSVIGNETQFDLNFRTERVRALKGQPLAGKKIVTYCAGLLMLSAQETDVPREDFFPIAEYPAGGNTTENLAQLGMAFGKDFISPTGALFSSHLKIIGQREPMYDPRRQVEEAVYDYFAESVTNKKLNASTDLYQTLRMKVAAAAKTNASLAQALVSAVGLNEETDLVAAARAKAVIETLDEIAYGSSGEYLLSQQAMRAPPARTLDPKSFTREQIATTQKFQQRHARLWSLWDQEKISPRSMRIELVNFYIAQGKATLDRRFFSVASAPQVAPKAAIPAGKAPAPAKGRLPALRRAGGK